MSETVESILSFLYEEEKVALLIANSSLHAQYACYLEDVRFDFLNYKWWISELALDEARSAWHAAVLELVEPMDTE